jgi:hypothetical protein
MTAHADWAEIQRPFVDQIRGGHQKEDVLMCLVMLSGWMKRSGVVVPARSARAG